MFEHAITFHKTQIRLDKHVLEADGNIYSDLHREAARARLETHEAILEELTRPIDGVRAGKALDVLNAMLIADQYEAKRLDRLSEGTEKGSFSRETMTSEIQVRTERAAALQVALILLAEAAERQVVRHQKRGTTYAIHGSGMLQTEQPLHDGAALVVYRGTVDGEWFFRPPGEMHDGRFVSDGALPEITPTDGYEVTLLFDDMDDRRVTLSRDEIALAETHAALSLDWVRTDDEDVWGDYVVREVLYVGGRVGSLGLRRL